mmetsp:Transcript_19369/g.31727  ORF Transcript_19369/g.31727 Transcript_19369/m.31727 type:complete len:314 (-) Transcript_19369:418-1359(-)|eukprot:CAMPEP_0184650076 /NCGR_PEP_ID=MMETSP0308-20130426/7563_1 /TAXON_ID=38269 /ORGANISM="Gloeochaete witrockiana, Strain SAG 46.84" /LENGTH=313 /DNA_ID=CAMNT_0027083325 /DNA_START=118 /DNA_END=1059 /DNA_ORIENTATION=-
MSYNEHESDLEYKKQVEAIKERYRSKQSEQKDRQDLLGKRSQQNGAKGKTGVSKTVKAEEENEESESAEVISLKAANLADETTTSLKRTLQKAQQANEIGANTATRLRVQSEQMDRVSGGVLNINSNLRTGERIINHMESPLAHFFSKVPGSAGGVPPPKPQPKTSSSPFKDFFQNPFGMKKDKASEGSSGQNTGSLSPDSTGRRTPQNNEESRDKLFAGRKKGSPVKGNDANGSGPEEDVVGKNLDRVERAKQEQDKDLEQIESLVGNLKGIAYEMQAEVKDQAGKIDALNDTAALTRNRVRKDVGRIRKLS